MQRTFVDEAAGPTAWSILRLPVCGRHQPKLRELFTQVSLDVTHNMTFVAMSLIVLSRLYSSGFVTICVFYCITSTIPIGLCFILC